MITFRYHVVSLVVVLFALAAGVALGGGPLSEIGRGQGAEELERAEARNDELAGDLEAARSTDRFQNEFVTQVAPRVLSGAVNQRPVAVVTLPGADEGVVASLITLVQQAGGSLSGTYAVQQGLVAGGNKSLVDTLGAQLLETVKDTGIPATATTYDRMGQLLGRAIGTVTDAGEPVDEAAKDLLSSLRGAELVTQTADTATRASLVIVVLGDGPAPEGTEKVVGGLLAGLATHTDAVTLAGSTSSATDGLLAALRKEVTFAANVSSVDSAQTTSGRVATLLALASDSAGKVGHFGAVGIDGPLPRG